MIWGFSHICGNSQIHRAGKPLPPIQMIPIEMYVRIRHGRIRKLRHGFGDIGKIQQKRWRNPPCRLFFIGERGQIPSRSFFFHGKLHSACQKTSAKSLLFSLPWKYWSWFVMKITNLAPVGQGTKMGDAMVEWQGSTSSPAAWHRYSWLRALPRQRE